jgi:hypothetical protein
MRYIRDIRNPEFKIGLYQWNGKYIIKIEAGGYYEQVYKVEESELTSDQEVDSLLDPDFMLAVSRRFEQMHADLLGSLKRNDLLF